MKVDIQLNRNRRSKMKVKSGIVQLTCIDVYSARVRPFANIYNTPIKLERRDLSTRRIIGLRGWVIIPRARFDFYASIATRKVEGEGETEGEASALTAAGRQLVVFNQLGVTRARSRNGELLMVRPRRPARKTRHDFKVKLGKCTGNETIAIRFSTFPPRTVSSTRILVSSFAHNANHDEKQ